MALPDQARSADTSRPGALRLARGLVAAYMGVSLATVAVIVYLANRRPDLVTPQAEVRATIVAVTSILTFIFAQRAVRGRPRALLRLRIVVAVLLVAVVGVLFFLALPKWMVVEQAACGALLLLTALLIFRPA